ncbi:MAG: hypothetical protein ACRC33_02350 [Gemmataceae bacterium]
MQTMNFQCGHCNSLMAVSVEFLGQQVRCPHCGGVVIAPAAPAPGPDLTRDLGPLAFDPRAAESQEDIFTEPSDTDDALFGADAPRLELPRAADPESGARAYAEVMPQSVLVQQEPPPETPTTGWSPPAAAEPPPVEMPYAPPPEEPRRPRPAARADWFMPLVFVPLLLYAAGISAVAVFLYLRLIAVPPSLFDRMPDAEGDNPGVRRDKVGLNFKKADALAPLPDHLLVKLTETLTVGDLEVTPLRVERKRVAVHVQGAPNPEPCRHDSLVLHLRLANVGADYRYTPMDNFFDRHWDGLAGPAPLTVLVGGPRPLFGGPAKWVRPGDKRDRRQWVDGRPERDPDGVGPGESVETFTCTDGEDPGAAKVIDTHRGKLLWRVHLRRGLIDHRGRPLPATCVVGVEFDSADYRGG